MTQAAFLLFVFLKQFYIKSSGSIGIADLCIAFCVIFLVVDILRGKRKFPSIAEVKRDGSFLLFLVCVLIINLFLLLKIAAWIMNDIPYTGFLMGRPYGVS